MAEKSKYFIVTAANGKVSIMPSNANTEKFLLQIQALYKGGSNAISFEEQTLNEDELSKIPELDEDKALELNPQASLLAGKLNEKDQEIAELKAQIASKTKKTKDEI